MEHVACDVLVLGSGAAGLRAAISAREAGLDVLVLSRAGPGKSTCTGFSGGVMRGAHGSGGPAHLESTLQAGRGINQPNLAEILCEEAPARLGELVRWGIQAEVRNGFLFAKGRPPVIGEEIVRCLLRKNMELGTRFMGNVIATGLVMENGVAGMTGFARRSGELIGFSSGAMVLATGGAAALSTFATTTPSECWGLGGHWRSRPARSSRIWSSCSFTRYAWPNPDMRPW